MPRLGSQSGAAAPSCRQRRMQPYRGWSWLKDERDERREAEHFAAEPEHFPGEKTAGEKAAEKALEAAVLPVAILSVVLAHDDRFRRYARRVDEQPEQANVIGRRYSRKG